MKTNRNIKSHHNGKNRHTGRKSTARRVNKGPATATCERAEEIRLAWVAAKLLEREQKSAAAAAAHAKGPCCADDAAKNATNLRLLRELQSIVCNRVWNETFGRWDGVMPRAFVSKNAAHMPHFREFARENGYRSR